MPEQGVVSPARALRLRRWTDRLAGGAPEGAPGGPLERGAEALAMRSGVGLAGGLRLSLQASAMAPGHRLEVLVDGDETFSAMLTAIAAATRSVDVETYIWESDATGHRFAAALAARARAGCKVRCLVDGGGSIASDLGRLFGGLIAAGGRVAVFHPVGPWRHRWGWTVRDHRKLLLVDGQVGFAGGINIGNEYAPAHWGGGKSWHDLHLRVEGPAVRELQGMFEDAWRYAAGDEERVLPETPASLPPKPAAPAQFPSPPSVPSVAPPVAPEEALALHGGEQRRPAGLAQVLSVGRRRDRRFIQRHYQFACVMARERIWISCAYFVPNRFWRRTLRKAALRGVDVRILVPRTNDIPAVHHASRYTYQPLLDAGVRIFEYLPAMLHAKALVVDGAWAAVGSYNLDQRSLMYNWEVAVAMVDPAACTRLERQFELDQKKSREIDPALWPRRGLQHKLLERFWYVFRLLL